MAAGVLPAFPLDPALGDQPVSMNMTIGPTDEPRGPALPFGRAAADGPANPARAEDGPKRIVVPAFDEAKVDFGSTLPDSFVLADMPWSKGPAALPFAPKAKRKGLPFVERDAKPPPPAATSPDGPALGIKGGTIMAMPAMSGDDAIPLDSPGAAGGANVVRRVAPSDRPVAAAKPTSPAEPTPSRSTEPSLTVGQFAQLLEELAAADKAPAAQAAREIVLTRHGFTEATFDELSSRWRKSAEKEPALFQELARARESYRRGRAGSR